MNNLDNNIDEDMDNNIGREEETSLLEPENGENMDDELETTFNQEDIPIVDKTKFTKDVRRAETNDKKNFLLNFLRQNIVKKDGPASKELIENFKVRIGKREQVLGGEYKGQKIIILVDGEFTYSKDVKSLKLINDFKKIVRKAQIEHQGTTSAQIEENIELQQISNDNLEEITSQVSIHSKERLQTEIDELKEDIYNNISKLSMGELREFNGALNLPETQTTVEKLENLEIEVEQWRLKKLKESDPEQEALYGKIEKIIRLTTDKLRLEKNLRTEEPETQEILKEKTELNDLNRFEKFKKWAKENLIGLSGIAIAIGGIITTVVVNARNVVKKGAEATSKFAKALVKLGKEVGPIASTILGVLGTVLRWGAKGVSFLRIFFLI